MNSGRFPTVTVTGVVPIDPIRGHLAPADPRDAERSPDLEPWAGPSVLWAGIMIDHRA